MENTKKSLLVVDADPVMNLPRALGVDVTSTVGAIATRLRRNIDGGKLSGAVAKQDILEAEIFEALEEGDRFDLLAMGRTEGEGCYCYVNRLLTQILDRLSMNYDVTLLDMSAGLEHLSRRTDRNVDVLIIVIDPSRAAYDAAFRIRDLAEEVHISFKRIVVVGNRFPVETERELRSRLESGGMTLIGMIPNDEELARVNNLGTPLTGLSDKSPAARAVLDIAQSLGILDESSFMELLHKNRQPL
jgi:CO dehydrogenase maturation factor